MKKIIYISLTMVLGILLSFFLHALIEFAYLEYARAHSITVRWNMDLGASCSLPGSVQSSILIFGVIAGFFLGRYWWRVIYVEKKYRNKLK